MCYKGKPLSPTLSPLVPRGEREKTAVLPGGGTVRVVVHVEVPPRKHRRGIQGFITIRASTSKVSSSSRAAFTALASSDKVRVIALDKSRTPRRAHSSN